MGAKIVLFLVAIGFVFIAAISMAAPKEIRKDHCTPLLMGNDAFPTLRVYGQESEVMFMNKQGEILILSRSEHSENLAAKRPGAIPIEYLSYKIAKIVSESDAEKIRDNRTARDRKASVELEPALAAIILGNIYSSGVRPTYRPAALRKSYLFTSPGGEESLLAVEHIQHADSMTDSQMESITAKIISAFEKR